MGRAITSRECDTDMADEGSAQQRGAEPPLSRRQQEQQRQQPEEVEEEKEQVQGERGERRAGEVPARAPFPPFVGRPVGETSRRYVDDAQPTAGQARATPEVTRARRRDRLRDERFRREIFELFESTRGLLTRWTIGRYLKEYRDPRQNTISVVTLDTAATAGEGLRLLAQANILSAPVVDTDRLLVRAAGSQKTISSRRDTKASATSPHIHEEIQPIIR